MVKRLIFTLLMVCAICDLVVNPALAQQAGANQAGEADIFAPVTDPNAAPPAGQSPATKTTKKVKSSAQVAAKPAAAPIGGSEVDQRLQQLEEQVADMQVAVGTMESFKGRASAGAVGTAPAGGDGDIRVGRLEAQMQALNAQMAELANQLRDLESRLPPGTGSTPMRAQPVVPRQSGALTGPYAKPGTIAGVLGEQPAAADTGFGQTTVSQGALGDAGAGQDGQDTDAAGAMQTTTLDPPPLAPQGQQTTGALRAQTKPFTSASAPDQDQQVAALPPPSNDPQTAYDQAYGLILQQDYAGAEGAFRDYIARFPQSQLAGNANYWLGQSFYARGLYKPAADAFLKGYKTYRTGQKAPDSLLKVAMSLSRLGQKDMACSAFTALDGEFPNASAQLKHLAQTERERTGC